MPPNEPQPSFVTRYELLTVPKQIITTEPLDDTLISQGEAFLENVVDSLGLSNRTRTDYINEKDTFIGPNRKADPGTAQYRHEVWFRNAQELASFQIMRDRERQIIRFAKYALLPKTVKKIRATNIGESVEAQHSF